MWQTMLKTTYIGNVEYLARSNNFISPIIAILEYQVNEESSSANGS